VGGRDGETFVSPSEQKRRIEDACSRDGLKLVETFEELDVSGGTALSKREGLRRAIELVESDRADVVVVAYFDRLVRSLSVQAEVVERVEQAGGAIIAVDVGEVRADTASRWLSSTMLGMVAEYHRRVTAERTQEAKLRAIERGVAPFPNLPPGYRRGKKGQLVRDPKCAAAVVAAFRLRAKGATVMDVREHLRQHGIKRSFHGTTSMLASRIYLGELRFGETVNLHSHTPLIDPDTWAAVQRMSSPRGPRPKSERLLARLGVLRCGTCGARLVVGTQTQNGRSYTFYRCPPNADCSRRVTISAEVAEATVVGAVREALRGMRGTASVAKGSEKAARKLERSERELDAAVRAFSGLDDVKSAQERLLALRAERDYARDALAELQVAIAPAITVTASDWGRLNNDERRALIRAVLDRATVAPGRGRDRITVHLRGK
jgi:DNA invertase Pin-like site-specific DNA recombinase